MIWALGVIISIFSPFVFGIERLWKEFSGHGGGIPPFFILLAKNVFSHTYGFIDMDGKIWFININRWLMNVHISTLGVEELYSFDLIGRMLDLAEEKLLKEVLIFEIEKLANSQENLSIPCVLPTK